MDKERKKTNMDKKSAKTKERSLIMDKERKKTNMDKKSANGITRRRFLGNSALLSAAWAGTLATGWVLRPQWANAAAGPIKIGLLMPTSGSNAPDGKSCVQMAEAWAKMKNGQGGILGRPIELYAEDYGSEPAKAPAAARRLALQKNVDMICGTIFSSTRNAAKHQITVRDKKLFMYPTLYEGGECTPNVFCTGPVPNQQFPPAGDYIVKQGKKRAALVGSDYIYPRNVNKAARRELEKRNIEIVFEEYYPMDQTDFSASAAKIHSEKIDCLVNAVIGGLLPFSKQVFETGFYKNGGLVFHPAFSDSSFDYVPSKFFPNVLGAQPSFWDVKSPENEFIRNAYYDIDPKMKVEPGTIANATWRALQLYEQAIIKTNGDLRTDAIAEALPGSRTELNAGGPAEMIKNHCKMNMYLAENQGGKMKVIAKDEMVDPRECI